MDINEIFDLANRHGIGGDSAEAVVAFAMDVQALERSACAALCRRAGDTFLAQERSMPLNRRADAGQVAAACEMAITMRSNAEVWGDAPTGAASHTTAGLCHGD